MKKMKTWISRILAVAMACSLALPAQAAASPADARLAAVTGKVKATLSLDTNVYTEFHGDLDDNPLSPVWNLRWSGEGVSLSVTATEEGKVLSYNCSSEDNTASPSSGTFSPAFPAGDVETAKAAALAFLDKVLDENETVQLNEKSGTVRLGATQYRFWGDILLNGLEAEMSFSISVACGSNEIRNFNRDGLTAVMGEVPGPEAKVTAEQAAKTLRDTLSLRLEYVLPEQEGSMAELRYLPNSGDEFIVDANTGGLVNLSEAFRDAAKRGGTLSNGSAAGGTMADASAPEAGPSLSPAEEAGIAGLEGVLSREALDSKARAIAELGLKDYTLSSASYSVNREETDGAKQVTAVLRYGRQVDGVSWRRTVSLDARTGELLAVSSTGQLTENGPARTVTLEAAQKTVESFLEKQASAQFAKTELYSSQEAKTESWSLSHSFTYAQKEQGYFYTGNAFYVGVDVTGGSISFYEKQFDSSVTFEAAKGLLTAEQALDAWLNTYTAKLSYVQVPAAVDYSMPEYQPLADMGISYLYNLTLGYRLDRDEYVLGLNAKTGEPVVHSVSSEEEITYEDLENHWAREKVETLARYGVGYLGGSFQPDKALTQLDLVALLASAQGYQYRPEEEGGANALYDYACSSGLISRQERNDSAVLNRLEVIRLILDASGYGPTARLEGIYRTGFTDDNDIPAEFYGYAALAQGLGIVSGASGKLLPNAGATRAEAAVMLFNLMSR
ncbi:MAG: S-layer homology domain-containing protein [Oscillospiraceae bacterium]|nr:S-layer homology domain-containing protein [Oscillospiraceae bacterium]